MSKKFAAFLFFGVLWLQSCTHSVHLVNFSEQRPNLKFSEGKAVTAHGSQFTILGFKTETHYVNDAYRSLLRQCPAGGVISGITTKYYTSHGFFSWTIHVQMEGTCFTNLVTKNRFN